MFAPRHASMSACVLAHTSGRTIPISGIESVDGPADGAVGAGAAVGAGDADGAAGDADGVDDADEPDGADAAGGAGAGSDQIPSDVAVCLPTQPSTIRPFDSWYWTMTSCVTGP